MVEKQFGTYQGNLKDSNFVSVGTEQEIFMLINSTGGFIWSMNHDASHGRFKMTKEIEQL